MQLYNGLSRDAVAALLGKGHALDTSKCWVWIMLLFMVVIAICIAMLLWLSRLV